MAHAYFDSPAKFLIFAHRGFVFENNARFLDENTLPAFSAALAAGADYLELDVQASSDGVAVVFHDEKLDRVSEQQGLVSDRTWLELQQITLRNGGKIPSLEQVLDAFPSAKINVDVKSATAIANVAEVIRRHGAQNRILLTSFSEARRRTAVSACPGVATSPSAELMLKIRFAQLFRLPIGGLLKQVNLLQIPVSYGVFRFDSPKFLESVKRHGVGVVFWTINEPNEAKRLRALGAAGIVTDRTDLMISALAN